MKNRTRLFLVVAVGVLVLGLGTGLLASYGFQNFAIIGGNGPDDLAYIPSEARMVAFADVSDLVNSELRQKVRAFEPNSDGQKKFETETGVDIERDIDQVLAAAWPTGPDAPQGQPLVLARGRFDTVRIEALVREHGGQVEEYKGKRLVVAPQQQNGTPQMHMAVGFIEPGLLAAGDAAAIRKAIDTKESSSGSVTANAELMKLIKDADDGNAWAVARFDAVTMGPFPQGLAQQLPPITWFSASGHINGGIHGTIRAEAKDEKAAQDLREVVRGFMALARLQAGQKAEFAELINSLELGGQGTTVSLDFAVPSQVIDALGALSAQRRTNQPSLEVRPKAPQAPRRPADPSL
jgi:hypothetical protein